MSAALLTDDERRFYEEDAQRLNAMCQFAKESGIIVDVKEGDPPELNTDGTLKNKG